MGIDTSAVAWFGYEGTDDFEWPESILDKWDEPDFGGDAEVVWCGWYDSSVQALAVKGTIRRGEFGGTPLQLVEVTPDQIARLKAAAERGGFPTNGQEPTWYFSARQF